MAERALTPAGVIVKWILIPAALLIGGFYIIGPRIGATAPLPGKNGDVKVTPVADADSASQSFAQPDVDVQTRPKIEPPDVQITARQRPHHRKPRVHPVVDEDPNAREPVDSYVPPSKAIRPKTFGPGT
jgi:hypothetical protein